MAARLIEIALAFSAFGTVMWALLPKLVQDAIKRALSSNPTEKKR